MIAGTAVAIALALVAHAMRPRPPLPIFGSVPEFHLVDERGAPFDRGALTGHVSVVDFIFTRCQSSCPRLTATMRVLQNRLARAGSRAHLVSISVDPENDSPAVLAAYAERAHADPSRWSFVTGPADDVERAIVFGFKVSAAKVPSGANESDVTHGDWFVLVDQLGTLRGYYATDEPGALDMLVENVLRLERAK